MSLLKLTQPNPLTRDNASHGACSPSIAVDEGPSAKDNQG
jgi:hypothetical protein